MITTNNFTNKNICTVLIKDKYTQLDNVYLNYKILKNNLLVPRNSRCIGITKCNEPVIANNSNFLATLRKPQQELADILISKANKDPYLDGIVVRDTAFGKTIMGIYLSCKLKLKTLVLVNRKVLITQWIDKISQFSDCKADTLKTYNDSTDILIATIQTMSKEKYYKKYRKDFGMLFIDECHTIPTDKFINCLFYYTPKVRLGFSATPNRSDQRDILLEPHLCTIFKETETKIIKKQNSTLLLLDFQEELEIKKDHKKKIIYHTYLQSILNSQNLFNCITSSISKILEFENKNILFLSDRLSQINQLKEVFPEAKLLTGKNKEDVTSESRLVLATSSVAGTGLDIPHLNCLIFGTPKKNLTQLLGRIYRQNHKESPIIIDFYTSLNTFSLNSMKARKSQIKKSINIDKVVDSLEFFNK